MKHLYYHILIPVLLSGIISAKRMRINWRKLMRDVSALSSMTFTALMMNYWITLTSPVYKTVEYMICWLLFIEHLMVTPLYILRIYSMKRILLTTYVANIFSMSPGLILQTMGYTLSVIQLVNFGTRYKTHSEPLLRPIFLN